MASDLRRTRSPREAAAASEAMVAGCVAGSIGQLVGFPLDTLKVRTQLQATREMALFSGWRVPVATAGAINCANFGVYDSAWRSLSDVDDDVDAPRYTLCMSTAALLWAAALLTQLTTQQRYVRKYRTRRRDTLHSPIVNHRGMASPDGKYRATTKSDDSSETTHLSDAATGRRLTIGEVARLWREDAFAQWFQLSLIHI